MDVSVLRMLRIEELGTQREGSGNNDYENGGDIEWLT